MKTSTHKKKKKKVIIGVTFKILLQCVVHRQEAVWWWFTDKNLIQVPLPKPFTVAFKNRHEQTL